MLRYRTVILNVVFLSCAWCMVLLINPNNPAASVSTLQAQASHAPSNSELAQLRAEIEQLKAADTNSAAMNEVDYHAQNLWFSGRAGNWPLASFYWDTVLLHMRVTKGSNLVSKASDSEQARATEVARLIENSQHMQVGTAIDRRDVVMFATTYRSLLQGCYNCHKAVGKPFLRPRMPVKPAQAIINVDVNASWPE